MADYDLEDRTNYGNEWDVVSLTASTYAAAPSYRDHDLNSNATVMPAFGGEIPRTMFLSDHFVFPPSEHENLPLEPDVDEHVGEERIDEETKEDNVSGEHDEEHSQLDTLDEHDVQQVFGGTLSEEEEAYPSKGVEVSGKDADLFADLQNSKTVKDDKLQPEIPPATWWKRHAASLYSNAKESNSFWSIFVAAAVMGLVIIGQRWQQERWQVLQLKLHLNVHDEKMARLLGPLTRLKDAVIGSHHRISFLRSSAPVKGLLKEKKLEMLVDPDLQTNYVESEAEQLIQVALLCTQGSPMEVVRMHEGDGLAEKWEEWQKVEVVRQELDLAPPSNSEWILESTDNLHAVELSVTR